MMFGDGKRRNEFAELLQVHGFRNGIIDGDYAMDTCGMTL